MLPPKVGAFNINPETGVSSLSGRAASFLKIVKHAEGSVNGCLLVVPGVGLRAISWPIVLLPVLASTTAQALRDQLETAALEGCVAADGGAGNNARDPGGGIGQVPRLHNWVGGVYITGAFRCTFDAVYDQKKFGLREKKQKKQKKQ